jgi:phosphatidylinositol alpha-mannosyltransferase
MKVGIVVPYSWSYWGAVPEHAELQADALRRVGVETRTIIGHDPPGSFTRVLHPRHGRHGRPPPDVIPVGRSVIVPANGALPNIVLSPASIPRIKRALREERFDVLHLHEPMTPAICTATLAWAPCPVVATFHASGELGWLKGGKVVWGFLMDRIDHRIAVSEAARESVSRYFPAEYELIPNGVLIPPDADAGKREHRIVFIGRHDPRKGMPVLLSAWPEIHRRTGARLRIVGADPIMVRLALARADVDDAAIDSLGFLSQEELTEELLSAKALVAPSLGGESFGMVLTRAFACATPAVASDITGYRDVMTDETGLLVPPGDPAALANALVALLEDEPGRRLLGEAARRLAQERYSWDDIARRLAAIYEGLG